MEVKVCKLGNGHPDPAANLPPTGCPALSCLARLPIIFLNTPFGYKKDWFGGFLGGGLYENTNI